MGYHWGGGQGPPPPKSSRCQAEMLESGSVTVVRVRVGAVGTNGTNIRGSIFATWQRGRVVRGRASRRAGLGSSPRAAQHFFLAAATTATQAFSEPHETSPPKRKLPPPPPPGGRGRGDPSIPSLSSPLPPILPLLITPPLEPLLLVPESPVGWGTTGVEGRDPHPQNPQDVRPKCSNPGQ